MILNPINIKDSDFFDYTIIGGGIVGISLALSLGESKKKVLLIESGNLDNTNQDRGPYDGKIYGDNYYPLDLCRQRTFGGGYNCWSGRLRTFDNWDFNNNYSNWPINYNEFDKYKQKALDFFVSNKDYSNIKDDLEPEFENNNNFKFHYYTHSDTYWDDHYKTISESKNIFLILNHSLVGIRTDGKKINNIEISSSQLNKIKIKSKKYILACGGIENSRILLYNNFLNNKTLVRNEKLIGKYWMEHPECYSGQIILFNGISKYQKYVDTNGWLAFSMTDNYKRQKNLTNNSARININRYPQENLKEKIRLLICENDYLKNFVEKRKHNFFCFEDLKITMETVPDINNRIELSSKETDLFGIPKSILYWKMNEADHENHKNYLLEFAKFLIDNDLGRLKIKSFVLDYRNHEIFNENYKNLSKWKETFEAEDLENGISYGYHHIGGTRCGKNNMEGIVDENLKVFDQENLYIVGSSVFPSAGFTNPTLPAVQLSLRLSEHLKEKYV